MLKYLQFVFPSTFQLFPLLNFWYSNDALVIFLVFTTCANCLSLCYSILKTIISRIIKITFNEYFWYYLTFYIFASGTFTCYWYFFYVAQRDEIIGLIIVRIIFVHNILYRYYSLPFTILKFINTKIRFRIVTVIIISFIKLITIG